MSKIALGSYGEPLVDDTRLERLFYSFQRLVQFPDGLRFATQLQEPVESQGPKAVFYVVSPHPRKNKLAITPHEVVSVMQMPYELWKEKEATYRHYANLTDPMRPIFATLLRQHLAKRENLEALD